ncbi:protogenin B-like [Diadema antillarum]|uniref:protogenin B-like n=1 Tax=Diadema antillarum TaxID=105358 RepID=UPI003A8C88F8
MERYGLIWHFVILFIYQLQCSLGFKNLTLLIEPGGRAVPPNSSLLLECEARSDDPTRYRWRHAGQWLDSELYVTASPWTYLNGSLRIERVWLDTVGTYQCCAGTGDGILCSRNATVSVAWIGIPQVFPSSVEVEAGTSIRLLCRVEAEPPEGFKIAWFRDGLSVAVGSQRVTQLLAGSAILHITSASHGDSGQYSCRASNQYGASRTSIHTATVTVVDPTPAGQDQWGIKVPPSTTKAVVGSDAVLECLLWREERMEVSWNRTDGRPIPWQRSTVLGLHNLLIRNVTVNDSAVYRCQVEDTSSGEVDSASAALTVLGPPRFLSPMTDLVRIENAMVRIVCNVTGSPTPHVQWFHNGEEVTGPGRISMYHQPGGIAELHIWSSMPQDEGFYQCFATNDFGTVWSGMYYTLKLPETRPPVPTNVTVFVNDSTSVIVKWKQVVDPAVLSYSIYYYPTPGEFHALPDAE